MVSYGRKSDEPKKQVRIALVGKVCRVARCLYFQLSKRSSVPAMPMMPDVKIDWIDANQVTADAAELLGSADGIIVPGGWSEGTGVKDSEGNPLCA